MRIMGEKRKTSRTATVTASGDVSLVMVLVMLASGSSTKSACWLRLSASMNRETSVVLKGPSRRSSWSRGDADGGGVELMVVRLGSQMSGGISSETNIRVNIKHYVS